MPNHSQHPFFSHFFLKSFSAVIPAVENNSLNSSVNIFLFQDSLFNNFDGDKLYEKTYLFVFLFISLFALNQYINGKIKLFRLGIIVNILWYEIPNHAPFVELGDFVVMPNQIHGILIFNKPNLQETLPAVETLHATSLQKN